MWVLLLPDLPGDPWPLSLTCGSSCSWTWQETPDPSAWHAGPPAPRPARWPLTPQPDSWVLPLPDLPGDTRPFCLTRGSSRSRTCQVTPNSSAWLVGPPAPGPARWPPTPQPDTRSSRSQLPDLAWPNQRLHPAVLICSRYPNPGSSRPLLSPLLLRPLHLPLPSACLNSIHSYRLSWTLSSVAPALASPAHKISCFFLRAPVTCPSDASSNKRSHWQLPLWSISCVPDPVLRESSEARPGLGSGRPHLKVWRWDFPGGPEAKTLPSQWWEPRFNPWSGHWIPCATTESSHATPRTQQRQESKNILDK